MDPRLVARAHIGGTWAYSRHTGGEKSDFEHEKKKQLAAQGRRVEP